MKIVVDGREYGEVEIYEIYKLINGKIQISHGPIPNIKEWLKKVKPHVVAYRKVGATTEPTKVDVPGIPRQNMEFVNE